MLLDKLSKLFVFSITVVFIAIYFKSKLNIQTMDFDVIKASLEKAEQKVDKESKLKVAVGFGGCMDILVDAVTFFDEMKVKPLTKVKHHDSIDNVEDLIEGFSYYFTHGAAGERYVTNDTLFLEMVDTAKRIPSNRLVVGGNAPVIANRLALEGADVLLASTGATDFIDTLHKDIKLAGSLVDKSDIHLILEYKSGQKWGPHTAPRANRYIAIADKYNPTISSLETFMKRYKDHDSDLYVVGGLQVMDNYRFKPGEREERLSLLSDLLFDIRSETKKLVHFEMASFVESSLLEDVVKFVLPHSDSLGMNEQELPNLISFLKFGNITMVSEAYPRVAFVLDSMRSLYNELIKIKVPRGLEKPGSRIHVHTLAFQAILTRVNSLWKNTEQAAAHASLTANRYICGNEEVDVATSKMLMDESFSTSIDSENANRINFSNENPVSCWTESLEDDEILLCVAPNLVCTKVFQTAGGGDNISAAGLRYQI